MKTERAIKITIETHELTTIRIGESRMVSIFCDICGKLTVHIPVSDMARALRLSSPAISRLVEEGNIHFVEGGFGAPLICTSAHSEKGKEDSVGPVR